MKSDKAYSITYDQHDQTLVFCGRIVPQSYREMQDTTSKLVEAIEQTQGILYMDFKRLSKINNTAFKGLASFLNWISKNRPELQVKIITTSVITWANKKFSLLAGISPKFTVEQYDKDFYPGQGAIENENFIPILRAQTRITWQQEQQILKHHGLKPDLRVADICCGIGDFAVLVHKVFKPKELVAVDHSRPSLEYARQVAKEFGISTIDYLYGDAASLMLEDNRFDFVTSRLSLQIFDKPELILRELYRICKPGGRVYLTNETYSKCFGEPHSKSVSWTYKEASRLFGGVGMDLEFGTKMSRYLQDCNFTNIMIEPMILTNLNVSPEDFVKVIRSWKEYVVGELAANAGEDQDFCTKLKAGFNDHISTITHAKGFGGWPIWVGSGMKPFK